MANTKMTKRDYFNALSEIVKSTNPANSADLLAFINHEVELLDKKNSYKSSNPTKAQLANEGLKATLLEVMAEVDKPATITELQRADTRLAFDENGSISNQRLSALLRQMIDSGTVVRTTEKKKAYFSLAVAE